MGKGDTFGHRKALARIDHLRATPAALRFLSIEPLLEDLGEIDLMGICAKREDMDPRRLPDRWEELARHAWHDAEHESDPMGRRLIEHGALIYQNCARELREALASIEPPPSTIPAGRRT